VSFPPLWQLQLVPASFKGVPFKVDEGGRTGGRRVAPFEFAKSNTPYTEDMGRRIKQFAITGYDLINRALQLPSLVAYSFPRSLPSLTMSWRLYADIAHADELVAQNKVIHPAFMPASGVALSPLMFPSAAAATPVFAPAPLPAPNPPPSVQSDDTEPLGMP
jgi:prophage DNA circulation protein